MRPSGADIVVTTVIAEEVRVTATLQEPAGPPSDASWAETLRRLRGYITARIGDADAAADLAQDVVTRSLAAGALERAEDLNGWLFRAAQNAIVDHHRSRRARNPDDQLGDLVEPELVERAPNRATRELARCVQPLIEDLPAKYRDALLAVDIEGQTHHAAAAQAGISTSGMKSRVQRGRHHLRDLLTRCCAVHVTRDGAISAYEPPAAPCACGPDASSTP